jgi:hypothetical protein
MVRQSPECAYDIAFFDEFARAVGWTERLSLENPELRQPSGSPAYLRSLRGYAPAMRRHLFASWPTRTKLLNYIRLSSQAQSTLPMASCDLGPCTRRV